MARTGSKNGKLRNVKELPRPVTVVETPGIPLRSHFAIFKNMTIRATFYYPETKG